MTPHSKGSHVSDVASIAPSAAYLAPSSGDPVEEIPEVEDFILDFELEEELYCDDYTLIYGHHVSDTHSENSPE